ncbi:Acetyl-CoA carboxylase 2 [Heterocephalus glaber]|uniref:Acetyl-CoA carboxylase 2 n=1 Tax=Heterocephalus glaber TaxID=10181 RepID=G5BL19_HETGA|nr:Acetyl-CoA carboxylase 2 [Heterocephalus glaber]
MTSVGSFAQLCKRLGGVPVGVIATETRTVEAAIPADPASLDSEAKIFQQAGQVVFPDSAYKTAPAIKDFNREKLPLVVFANWRGFSGGMKGSSVLQIFQQAGQVWFPDSAYKTAQAIKDFNREKLPLVVFANWRGFSGGMKGGSVLQIFQQAGQVWFPDSAYKTAQAIKDFNREKLTLVVFANWRGFSGGMKDMYDQVLKFGSYIVDGLRQYQQPILIYLPPYAELRGGSWVVLDTTINPLCIEMYADKESRCVGRWLRIMGAIITS